MTRHKFFFMICWMLLAQTAYAYTPKQIESYAKRCFPKKDTCIARARVAKELAEQDGWMVKVLHEINARGRHRALKLIDPTTGKAWEILH